MKCSAAVTNLGDLIFHYRKLVHFLDTSSVKLAIPSLLIYVPKHVPNTRTQNLSVLLYFYLLSLHHTLMRCEPQQAPQIIMYCLSLNWSKFQEFRFWLCKGQLPIFQQVTHAMVLTVIYIITVRMKAEIPYSYNSSYRSLPLFDSICFRYKDLHVTAAGLFWHK